MLVLAVMAAFVFGMSFTTSTTTYADGEDTEVATMPDFVYGPDFDATNGYTTGAYNEHQVYKALIYWGVTQGLTPEQIGQAVGIVKRESNFNPNALCYNPPIEISVGPAQFNRLGGLWYNLPPGREGWPDTNAAQQMRALTYGLKNGYERHWWTQAQWNAYYGRY